MGIRNREYALASGEYDDYRVHCVVEGGEEAATALASQINEKYRTYDDFRVEALPVVGLDVQPVVEVLKLRVTISDDGLETDHSEHTEARWPWDSEELIGSEEVPAWWTWSHFGDSTYGTLSAWGTDQDRVRALFESHRQELLRDELGGLRRMRSRDGAR